MKDVQCYELFGGIALKNHAFSFHFSFNAYDIYIYMYIYKSQNETAKSNFKDTLIQ